jgi:hypothetical protein
VGSGGSLGWEEISRVIVRTCTFQSLATLFDKYEEIVHRRKKAWALLLNSSFVNLGVGSQK